MQCPEIPSPNVEYGSGLLVAAYAFHNSRPNQPYSTEINYALDRYISVARELLQVNPITAWLQGHRQSWAFMERELVEPHHLGNSHGQVRGHYGGREGNATSMPLDHHQSDSDMAGINDSDEEDEDSRFEEMETYHDVPAEIIVEDAGHPVVNGVYHRDGYFEGACRYSMHGKYKGELSVFSLFQCNVSNNTKHWYISIVPRNSQPGTSTDIDFYSAPVLDNCAQYPPTNTWTTSNEGRDPPPKLIYRDTAPQNIDPTVSPGRGDAIDEETHGVQTLL